MKQFGDEPRRIEPGQPVVVVMRTPNMNFFMEWLNRAAGFVFEFGGRLCHAALICLESGKPCVVQAVGLIQRLKPTSFLIVDAFTGTVTILKEDR